MSPPSREDTAIATPQAHPADSPSDDANHSRRAHGRRPLVRIRCANATCGIRFTAGLTDQGQPHHCPRCGREHPVAAIPPDRMFEICPVCGGDELYVRKDFPQRAGLALVVVVALWSCWLFARGDLPWALGVLAAVVVLDLLVYLVVPRITVCYRCRSEICGAVIHPSHSGFDLATAEKYR